MISFVSQTASADFDLKCYLKDNCNGNVSRSSSNPSTGSQVKINPSAVPTANGFGIEGIFFKDEVDVALVRGTGRVGAALSPSNSEETFFGPPGFELQSDYSERHRLLEKYPNQKFTFAAAANVIDKKGSGFSAFSLKLGAMAKYNKLTTAVTPGFGLNGLWGSFTFGASVYQDQTQIDDPYSTPSIYKIKYQVQTYNVGVFLNSLVLDYSHLTLNEIDNDYSSDSMGVSLFTASLLINRFIVTASKRVEDSSRPVYNYTTHQLDYIQVKEDYFGGVQYSATKNLLVGVLYNFYMLHEFSISTTLFF